METFFFGVVFSSLQLRLFLLYLSLFFIIVYFYKFCSLKNIDKVKKDMKIYDILIEFDFSQR